MNTSIWPQGRLALIFRSFSFGMGIEKEHISKNIPTTMKTTLLLALLLMSTFVSHAQLKEKDILGTWEMKFNIKEEAKKEMEEENILARALSEGILGFVDAVLDEVSIRMEFQEKNRVEIRAYSDFDIDDEVEVTRWFIDKQGRLNFDTSKNADVNIDFNDGWVMEEGKLYPIDEEGSISRAVYLRKVK